MFERFTDNARRAVQFARSEAADVGATEIESQHLLMGIITADRRNIEGIIGKAFVDLIQEQVLLKNRKAATASTGELPLSSECKRIISAAQDQAASLGSLFAPGKHCPLTCASREQPRLVEKLIRKDVIDVNWLFHEAHIDQFLLHGHPLWPC